MTKSESALLPDDPPTRASFDAQMRRVRAKLLDTIEATIDDLQPARRQLEKPRAAIGRILRTQLAPLVCRRATCRRAQICRRKPCTALPAE